ncbi:MAG TPA: hypothetical protein VF449_10865 [Parvibaculum sp.]
MRKITLAAAAGAVGFMVAAAPASAYTTYQINTAETQAALNENANADQDQSSGLTIRTTNDAARDQAASAFSPYSTTATPTHFQQQQNLSGDMNWQGTGYYLRPSN